ncbi:restriction endonuclease subunit S [Streptomyces sp. NBC_01707]|uniref:restriction endonuclease subunit S n=1 Tax=Streptomyces sp. NBC_01707 TaxID=2975914 RepID=UPI00352BFB11
MSWVDTRLKHLCMDTGQYGLNVSADQYSQSGVRLIRTSDISSDGSLSAPENGVHVDLVVEPRHRLRPGDVLLSRSGTLGRSFLVPREANGQTFAGFLIRFRPRNDVDPRFLYYATQSLPFQEVVHSEAVASTIQNFNAERYSNIALRAPEAAEQRRIADFLDTETSRIDNLATLGARQVTLLRERSEALMTQFFTQGDGRREYRFRHLMQSNPCYGVLVPKFADVGVPLIRVSDLGRLDMDLDRLPRIEDEQAQEYKRTRISPGDLLITVVGATIGRCDVAPPEIDGFNISRALARVQLASGISPQMIASWVRSRDFRIQAELATSGAAAQPALNMSDITHFTVWLPETDSGRRDLARRVSAHEHENRRLLSAIARKKSFIAERRQALITAAVTGQFDVSTASGRNVTDGVTA